MKKCWIGLCFSDNWSDAKADIIRLQGSFFLNHRNGHDDMPSGVSQCLSHSLLYKNSSVFCQSLAVQICQKRTFSTMDSNPVVSCSEEFDPLNMVHAPLRLWKCRTCFAFMYTIVQHLISDCQYSTNHRKESQTLLLVVFFPVVEELW